MDPESATFAHFVAIKQDITERMRAQDAVAESERRYRSLFENMLEGFAYCEMIFDDRGRAQDFVYLAVNGSFEKLTGLKDVIGRKFSEVVPGGDRSQPELMEKIQPSGTDRRASTIRDRSCRLEECGSRSQPTPRGTDVLSPLSITSRSASRPRRRFGKRKKSIGLSSKMPSSPSFRARPTGAIPSRIRRWPVCSATTLPQELVTSITDISRQVYVDPKSREEFKRLLNEQGTVSDFECQIYRKDGSKMWISASARAVFKAGVLVGYDGMNEDITDRKVAEERVQYLAYYDALTDVPNRTLLQDRLSKALASARRQKDKVALLFLDLDRFKNINDSLGHALGDLLLQKVAERLKRWAREQDTVARLGGDEFLIVLTRIRDVADAAVAAERLMAAMTNEFIVQGNPLSISCSLGISIFPDHGESGEILIKNADAAMYSAKEKGRNNFRFFTEKMNAEVGERLTLENSLAAGARKK